MNTVIDFLNYFFSLNPGTAFANQWIYWVLIGFSTFLAFYLFYLIRNKTDKNLKKLIKPYPSRLLLINILIMLYIFLRTSNVQVFSMRMVLYILIAWLLWTFYKIYHNYFVVYPKKQK
ncbi:MAG: hypothetical protein ACRCZE_05365 [Candidatus Altimarinota bacterium]